MGSFSLSDLNEPHIDILAAFGLPAMHCHDVLARPQAGTRFGLNRHFFVVGNVAWDFCSQDPVEVNLGVFVVMDVETQVLEGASREHELAANPDVIRLPFRAHNSTRGALGAETAGALFPGRIVISRLE